VARTNARGDIFNKEPMEDLRLLFSKILDNNKGVDPPNKRTFTVATKLDDENYSDWAFLMKTMLRGCKLWYCVDKEEEKPANAS